MCHVVIFFLGTFSNKSKRQSCELDQYGKVCVESLVTHVVVGEKSAVPDLQNFSRPKKKQILGHQSGIQKFAQNRTSLISFSNNNGTRVTVLVQIHQVYFPWQE